jgi:hypothetical protein
MLACAIALVLAGSGQGGVRRAAAPEPSAGTSRTVTPGIADRATPRARLLAEAAASQVGRTTSYDAAYVVLAYPGGDVPIERGVCTDVVVRAMREMDVDLQVAVHRDMSRAFGAYPRKWGLKRPDSNIDHRRVPNLMTYFKRGGKSVPITTDPEDYRPGDFVTWELAGGRLPHIGVVSTQRSHDGERFMIVHNIGRGTQVEDVLFVPWIGRITGHYRWF